MYRDYWYHVSVVYIYDDMNWWLTTLLRFIISNRSRVSKHLRCTHRWPLKRPDFFSAGAGESLNSDRRVNFCDCELYRFWWLLFITTSSVSLVPYNFAKPFSSPSFVSDSKTPGPFIIIVSLFYFLLLLLLPTPSLYSFRQILWECISSVSSPPIEPQKLHSDKIKRSL
jgi:hypothetical protein